MSKLSLGNRLQQLVRRPAKWAEKFSIDEAGLSAFARTVRPFDKRSTSRVFEPFDALEIEVVSALLDVMCDPGDTHAPPPDIPRLVRSVERFVLRLPETSRQRFRHLLVALEHDGFPTGTRFTECNRADQESRLFKWTDRRRNSFEFLKYVCMNAYWTGPAAMAGLGLLTPDDSLC